MTPLRKQIWIFAGLVLLAGGFVYLNNGREPSAAVAGVAADESEPATIAPVPQSVRVPILAYHNIRPTPSRAMSAADKQYEVTPEQFERQMSYLKSEGFTTVSFSELAAAVRGESVMPERPVLVSLDDGRATQYEFALPILKKHGLTATFFVFTNAIGRPGYLTADQIREMRDMGMEIGSHTRFHQFLTRMEDDMEVASELSVSKAALEEILGQPVTTLAYPFGLHDERIERLTREAGYETARGLEHQRTHAPEDLLKLGSFITTGDETAFRMIISTP